jgi:hypothetical protein
LVVINLAMSPVVQTLSNARSISRNKVTVALLLLKLCVMRSTFLSNARVVERPDLKPYWSFLIVFSFLSWKLVFQNDLKMFT